MPSVRAEVLDLFWGLYREQRQAWDLRRLYRATRYEQRHPPKPKKPRKPKPLDRAPCLMMPVVKMPRAELLSVYPEAADNKAIAKALRPKLPPGPNNDLDYGPPLIKLR